jgi:hypothetical protein
VASGGWSRQVERVSPRLATHRKINCSIDRSRVSRPQRSAQVNIVFMP